MAGGHLDSWHSATGATDNAIGCAIMMEAARILKALGVQPRRTIRIALWSGEEEGLLGSLAYVKAHFGSAEDPLPEFSKFNGYLNIDTGTGRLRGASVFGPPEGGEDPGASILAPFKDLKIGGASAEREPRHRRHRQHVVQQRRPAGHRLQPGPHRVQQPHAPHQSRHLRARDRAGRARRRRRRRRDAVSAGDAGAAAAPLRPGQDAARHRRSAAAAATEYGREPEGPALGMCRPGLRGPVEREHTCPD